MPQRNRIELTITAQDAWSHARATAFRTTHGLVETPIFMPVATQAALRGVDTTVADEFGYQVLLANTYHLLLRPGPEVFRKLGGIQKFMKWPRSVLTDSGGYQLFSLSRQLKLSEEGAIFRSYVDGREVALTPESSVAMQAAIGSDIMMALDHCISSTSDEATARKALALTERWARRSFAARAEASEQALFGIVQGACFPELRRESVEQITQIPFDGFAIGGLAVGETKAEREDITELTAPLLPSDRPRYLMGVGTPIDLLEAVKRGVDMFDCIIPTALALQGVCFTSTGKIDLRRGVYRHAEEALDKVCPCSTCRRHSRAYLHHLVRADEFVANQLLSVHNLAFYRSLMKRMRDSIIEGNFKEFYLNERSSLMEGDRENPPRPPKVRQSGGKLTLGDFEVREHKEGYGCIRQISSGETMHSVNDPMQEASSLYVEQPGVIATLSDPGDRLVVWDVGLGAATNAMVLILECEAVQSQARPLEIVSFENDLDSLRLALLHPRLFRHVRHAAPHSLLKEGQWRSENAPILWRLEKGDFLDQVNEATPPDMIWFDPFSYKTDERLWSVETFGKILQRCEGKSCRLYTYTASTAARAAMLAAGWYIGPGRGTGPKAETTIAYSPFAARGLPPSTLFGAEWLQKWKRSEAKHPLGASDPGVVHRIARHPQFAGSL